MREQDNNNAAKHARILQTAVELFTERDFHQVSMDDVLCHEDHDTPDAMTPLAVRLFLDGLSNFAPSLEPADIRLTAEGRSRVRAAARRATALD